ncbi:adenylate/guanylate cyclase domain-containing protein [Candidatus Amesbacteria bacterium]|nr:adenylate/guanylate cyclase domain-containing protein [Candidatus Amesbacteria bacterium]
MSKLWSNISLLVISYLFLAGLFWIGQFGGAQERLTDLLFLPRSVNQDIIIVAIDDKSINKIGRWPWSRKVHAELLEKLSVVRPTAIGYDVAFPEASNPESDQALSLAFSKHNIILPVEQVDMGLQKPYELFQTKTGLVNVLVDNDGIVRKIPIDSFASKIINKKAEINGNYLRINYSGKPGSFNTYSFIDVLENKIPLENFANKYVLVGATAVDLHDSQVTPVSMGREMAGVEIHANAMTTILENKYLIAESKSFTLLTIFIFTLLAVITASWPIAWLWLILFIIYSFVSFDLGIIRNLIYTPLAIILVNIISLIIRYLSERSQKEYIRKAFSYYLSDSVLKEILKDPSKLRLGGERKEITVLFTDIAGFTSISEKMDPVDLAKLLNDYLTRMTNIVFANKGVLDKYIGDAVMAFWNAPIANPDHAYLACKTALEMQKETGEFGMRIGINTGDMVVGNMGSQMRFDYSLLGDNVNLGSRLEGINKEYGTKILISQSTQSLISNQLITRLIDTVAVKGKEKGVRIYELRNMNYDTNFDVARDLYEKGEFAKAAKIFEKIIDDPPAKVFLARCQEYIKIPPPRWDGIYHAKEK